MRLGASRVRKSHAHPMSFRNIEIVEDGSEGRVRRFATTGPMRRVDGVQRGARGRDFLPDFRSRFRTREPKGRAWRLCPPTRPLFGRRVHFPSPASNRRPFKPSRLGCRLGRRGCPLGATTGTSWPGGPRAQTRALPAGRLSAAERENPKHALGFARQVDRDSSLMSAASSASANSGPSALHKRCGRLAGQL